MLPNQASTPLRRMLRPCVRLYQQHSAFKAEPRKVCPVSLTELPPNSPVLHSVSVGRLLLNHAHCSARNAKTFSTSCVLCDIVEEQAEDEEKKLMKFENGEKAQVIMDASFKELMAMAPKVQSGFQACLILQRMSALHRDGETLSMDGETLLQDPCLSKVTHLVDQDIMRLSPKVVLATLQALYEITATDVYLIKSLITQVVWLMRRLPMSVLIQVLQLHLSHQETSLRESLVKQTTAVLERRWVELTNPKDIIYLMYTTQGGPAANRALMERLEDRALDIVETATPKELYRIFYLLSRQRHRNTPLIRAVVYHLNKTSVSSLSAVQLTNLVYALSTLNVYDVPVLSKVCAELSNKETDLHPKLAMSLMTSFSRLRWRESSSIQMLLNILDGKVKQSLQEDATESGGAPEQQASPLEFLNTSDKVALVWSLANLNLRTAQSRDMVEKAVKSPDVQALRQSSPLLWLDVVWSSSVLQMLDATSAASVLEEGFWGNLPASVDFQSTVNLTKLNNINIAARYELEGYAGPFLPDPVTTVDAKLLQKGERRVTEKLVSALTNMAPLESYTLTNTTAPGGYLIDAEFYVDSNGTPKPMSQASQSPSDCHRVALKVLDFPDLTLPTSDLTGLHDMAIRHLRCQGYTVVQVLYTEVSGKSKVVELVQYLQQKVQEALKVKGPSETSS